MRAITRHRTNEQERLPKRLSLAQTKSSLRQRQIVKKDQSTLTQLGWATPSFTSVDEGPEVSDPDYEDARPRKKRKIQDKLTEEELKQATLTQIGWPFDENQSDVPQNDKESSQDETESEDSVVNEAVNGSDADMEGTDVLPGLLLEEQNAEGVTPPEWNHQHLERPISHNHDEASATRNSSTSPSNTASHPSQPLSSSRRAKPRRKHIALPSPELGYSPAQAITAASSPFKTPRNPLRLEVPSSQSPATTPLSTISVSSPKQTMLRELSFHEWSQRDNTPTPERRKLMPDSEDLNEDKENAFLDSDDEQDLSSGKSQPRMLFQAFPAKDAPDSSCEVRNTDTLAMPPPRSRPYVSYPPSPEPAACKARSMLQNSNRHSPSPKRPVTNDSDAKVRSSQEEISESKSLNNHQYGTIRSSQATTVDITQQSPLHPASQPLSSNHSTPSPASPHQPLPSRPSPQAVADPHKPAEVFYAFVPQLPPSPPPAFESQFPYSMFSHYSDDDLHIRYGEIEDSQMPQSTAGDFSP